MLQGHPGQPFQDFMRVCDPTSRLGKFPGILVRNRADDYQYSQPQPKASADLCSNIPFHYIAVSFPGC